jgi:hypothetical protein
MCWSWKRSLGFSIGKLWEAMRKEWQAQNVYRRIRNQVEVPRIVLFKTWEDLLSGHPIWFNNTILQLVFGKGLIWSPL